MRVEQRNGYRVVIGGPVPPQAEAITLGNTIIVRSASADQQGLMAHELVHVRQFSELGPVQFLLRYVGSYLRFRLSGYGHMAAYRRIPLEVEASWLSRLHRVPELEPAPVAEQPARRSARHSAKRSGLAPTSPGWNRSAALRSVRSARRNRSTTSG